MEKFVEANLVLLSLERETEIAESEGFVKRSLENPKELEAKGVCLQRLHVSSQRVGLYGRQVVTFEPLGKATNRRFVANTIGPGDIVGVFVGGKSPTEKPLSGIVTRSTDTSVSVAFDDLQEFVDISAHDGSLQVVKLANDVTYKRIKRSLEELRKCNHSSPAAHLTTVLFGESPLGPVDSRLPSLPTSPKEEGEEGGESYGVHFVNGSLDSSQKRAVVFALARPDVAIIHGPPGTGKTTTLVEFILQCIKRGEKVLACAPSNIAVDNLVERLSAARAKVVRLGHPARLVESVQKFSLDALLSESDSTRIVEDVRKDLEKAMLNSSKAKSAGEKRKWRGEARGLRKELHNREEKATKELLSSADVVLATNTGASADGPLKYVEESHFDCVVIDECAQATEASCWIPLLRASKCVLAGDHLQLPPTILSKEAASRGLKVTLMERLVQLYDKQVTAMLDVQYRMHEKIMAWPSQYLYGGKLRAHISVATHLLKDLPGVKETSETSQVLLFIDTAGCDVLELETTDEESKGNEGEADLVLHHVKSLMESGLSAKDIAIIAPYNLQVDLIRQRVECLSSGRPEVHTVDGFQGREKEAVIISFTRSNPKGEFGFLREQRRTNVAMTRARRHLALIGDSETISKEPFIKGLVDYCHSHGQVLSAHEYLHDSSFEEGHHYKPKAKKASDQTAVKTTRPPPPADWEHGRPGCKGEKRKQVNRPMMQPVEPSCAVVKEGDITGINTNDEATATIRQQLEEFALHSDQVGMSFPSTLTPGERKIVHELCEEMGLSHVSSGVGNTRYIQVGKPELGKCGKKDDTSIVKDGITQEVKPSDPHKTPREAVAGREVVGREVVGREVVGREVVGRVEAAELDELGTVPSLAAAGTSEVDDDESDSSGSVESDEGETKIAVGEKVCELCQKHVLLANFVTHQARCSRLCTNSTPDPSTCSKTSQKKSSSKSKKKDGSTQSPVLGDGDDLDSMLAELSLSDSTCKYSNCKKSVNYVSQRCSFCSGRFCMAHGIPEIHGCGAAAKRHARHEAVSHGPKSKKTLDPNKRGHLQRRLDKKIEEATSGRRVKHVGK